MKLMQVVLLAAIQGACELLPVSSSAHVIVAGKLMGIDPTAPETTLLLVMLHTGTMLAVIVYFWRSWRQRYFASMSRFGTAAKEVVVATAVTGVVGFALLLIIEKGILGGSAHAEVEALFGNPYVIAIGLAAAGVMIIVASRQAAADMQPGVVGLRSACWIGLVQAFCLPFRGFSRSGSTISTGLLLGLEKHRVEEFSFVLAVVLTPPVIAREAYRLLRAHAAHIGAGGSVVDLFLPGLGGMAASFLAGLIALRWLSRWLEAGRWHYFGFYCLFAAAAVLASTRFMQW